MPVWLVTGGSGFIGRHVLNTLGRETVDVVALGRKCPRGWNPRRFVVADLEVPETVSRGVQEIQPDVVIHAAGRTPPADPASLYRGNTLATVNLLDALRPARKSCRVVIVGSAAELGPVEVEDLPVGEDHPSRPVEPYGLSKWLATSAALVARPPLEVVSARVFNPIGPGQPLNQAFGRFAAILLDHDPAPLMVGDLEARRDFIDVRDVARALIALGDRGDGGLIYHVGTGRSHRVGDGLERLVRLCGKKIEVRVDPKLTGGTGPRDSRSDVRRILEQTGWRPSIPFEQSLDDLWGEAESRSRLPLTA